MGGFGAEPCQVQQGSGEPGQVQQVPEKVAEKVAEKVLAIFGAAPGQVQRVQEKVPEKVAEKVPEKFVFSFCLHACAHWGFVTKMLRLLGIPPKPIL